MQLHCLGTAGYHPNDSRHTSCFFLPESGIVLDGGSGVFRLSNLIQTDTLDILLSHAHLDHTLGLTFLLDVLFQCEKRRKPVHQIRVWGEAEKLDAVQNHLLHELIFPATLNFQWLPIDDLQNFAIGDCDISWRPQDHPGGSVAYRLDWSDPNGTGSSIAGSGIAGSGKRLVYATDTTGDVSDEHADWSQGADLLLHECYFQTADAEWAVKTGHSWSDRVAQVAAKSKPKHLLLTHINPIEESNDPVEIDRIRNALTGDVTLATDGMVIDF